MSEIKTFSFNSRVYFEDTDAGGIVYYANYLKFCERARTEWLRLSGISQSQLLESNKGFVIRSIEGRYIRSAKLDDELNVFVIPFHLGACGLKIYQEVYNQHNELLFKFSCSLAFIDFTRSKPIPMPKDGRDFIKSYLNLNIQGIGD